MILLPRPAPHLPESLETLHTAGFDDIHPLATSFPEAVPLNFPPKTTVLLLTSSLALSALQSTPQAQLCPLYAVGAATATAAHKQGFQVKGEGTTHADAMLNHLLSQNLTPQHILYVHGDNIDFTSLPGWRTRLETQGHTFTAACGYRLNPVEHLAEVDTALLRHKHPTHTLLFSVGSTQLLANLFKKANIPLTGTAVALSPAVACAAEGLWPQITLATSHTLAGMAEALGKEIHS